MTQTVIVWQIIDSYDSPYDFYWTVGRYIHCIFDDSTSTITTEIRDASTPGSGTLITTPTSGPSLFFGNGGVSVRLTADPLYQYCDGVDLKQIGPQNSWPYAHLATTANAVECQIAPVCDVNIDNLYTTVDSTGIGNDDGEIQVSATGSNGEIRFGLYESFDYATASPSGLFTGLVAGDYTVYAKDALGCTDFIDVTVKVTQVYGVKYRFEFDDARNNTHTVDILQRAYSGAITEFCGGDTPFYIRYNLDLNNKYDAIVFSEVELKLFNQVDEQFIELFQGDDQEYKIQYYDKTSTLRWVGYIVQQFYQQSIVTATNFYCTVTASDNLAILQNDNYSDIDGNVLTGRSSHLYIIQLLLQKTGLNLNLRSYVDLFENSMSATDTDDVLPQAFISNNIFYADDGNTPNKSIEVLQKILKVYGAQLFQTNGVWNIRRVENSVGLIEYREFDFEGTYIGNGTTDTDLILAGRSVNGEANWRDASQGLQLLQNYGKITLVNDLGLDNNLIDSGSFELKYLVKNGSGVYFFDGWNILQGGAGVRYGIEQVDNGDSKGALYVDFDNAFVAGNDTIVYSKLIPVINTGQITLSFQFQAVPNYNLPFIRFGYRVKITNGTDIKYLFVTLGNASFIDDSAGIDDWNNSGYINEIYCTSYSDWQTFEKSFLLPVSSLPWQMEVTFFLNPLYGFEITDTDFSNLKGTGTSSRLQGIRRKYMLDNSAPSNPILYDYLLMPSDSTESESTPDIVEPNDYSSLTNTSRWKIQNKLTIGAGRYMNKYLIDNVKISEKIYIFSPTTLLVDPPKTIEYSNTPNKYNLNKFSDTFYLGDLPNIANSELIYNGWISLSDGTPTTSWTRKGLGEDKFIIDILLQDYTAQLQDQTERLVGNVLSDDFISYMNSFTHEGSKYKIHGYSFDAKNVSYSLELLGIIVGENGLPPPDITYEFTTEFSTEFDA